MIPMRQYLSSIAVILLASCVNGPGQPTAAQRFAASKLSTSLIPVGPEELEKVKLMEPIDQARFWNKEYDKSPGNAGIALAFARALRNINSEEKAAEIAAAALSLKPADPELSEIYARAAMARARPDLAASALIQAETNFNQQWRLYSLLGVALDQLQQHKKARRRYEKALQIAPDEPSIMANLALSHALDGDPDTAETILRRAANMPKADSKIRQNLALILGIQGKFDEAKNISSQDLTNQQTNSNIQYFRKMLAPKRNWSETKFKKADSQQNSP